MRVLVTGAAGFIGRWVVADLLERGHHVLPVDNLVAGDPLNLAEFAGHPNMRPLDVGDIRDPDACRRWVRDVDAIAHLAASISVQDSIDDPATTFENDVVGTFNLLESARSAGARFLFMSTCMVYDRSTSRSGIDELHPTKPASPYAASKLAGEALTLSYHHAYGLPTTVIRPFNTYGPFQRSVGEGGVVAIFTRRSLLGETLRIYGEGTQTRDLLYVTDCARFVTDALLSDAVTGRILNAGTGADISVNELASAIEADPARITHVEHIHPQSEIAVLRCDARQAREILGWVPRTPVGRGSRPDARLDGREARPRPAGGLRSTVTVGRRASLAIEGGTPVRTTFLPYARQQISDDDVAAVSDALRSDWLTTGPRVPDFEAAMVASTGARHAIAFSSGTAALHGATVAAGLGPGDEAITTPLTFAATANAVLYAGAEVRFADIEAGSLLIDPDRVAAALTDRTRAILAVDYAGQPADYDALRLVADGAHGGRQTIIADASHSLGATRGSRAVGTLADMTVLSFHPAKIITTGEGGAVLTDDDGHAARLRRFRNHGIATELAARTDWTYAMVELGYNYRLTDIAAALGSSQIARLDGFLARRRDLAARYRSSLEGHPDLETPAVDSSTDPAWHFYFVQLRLDRLAVDRGGVYRALRAEGIGVNVHYIPVHQHPFYRDRYPGLTFPVADGAYERLLTLPLHAGMTTADVDDVVAALDKVMHAYRLD